MMRFVTPNSLGSHRGVREFNACHHPGGSGKGGQFCSKQSGAWTARDEGEGMAWKVKITPAAFGQRSENVRNIVSVLTSRAVGSGRGGSVNILQHVTSLVAQGRATPEDGALAARVVTALARNAFLGFDTALQIDNAIADIPSNFEFASSDPDIQAAKRTLGIGGIHPPGIRPTDLPTPAPAPATPPTRTTPPAARQTFSQQPTVVQMTSHTSIPVPTMTDLFPGRTPEELANSLLAGCGGTYEVSLSGNGGPPTPPPPDAQQQFETFKQTEHARVKAQKEFDQNQDWDANQIGFNVSITPTARAAAMSLATVLNQRGVAIRGEQPVSDAAMAAVRAFYRPAGAMAAAADTGGGFLPGMAPPRSRAPRQPSFQFALPGERQLPRTADEALAQLTELIYASRAERAARMLAPGGTASGVGLPYGEGNEGLYQHEQELVRAWAAVVKPSGAVLRRLSGPMPTWLATPPRGATAPEAPAMFSRAMDVIKSRRGITKDQYLSRAYGWRDPQQGVTGHAQAVADRHVAGLAYARFVQDRWPSQSGLANATLSVSGGNGASITRYFNRQADGSYTVSHSYFRVGGQEAPGFGKQFFANCFREYERVGVTSVSVGANIDVGAYAWARYGFVPSNDSTYRSFSSHFQNLTSGMAGNQLQHKDKVRDPSTGRGLVTTVRATPTAKHVAGLRKLITRMSSATTEKGRQRAFRAIIDSRIKGEVKIGNRWVPHQFSFGKFLLVDRGMSWGGKLDMRDTETMARFWKYVGGR